MMMNIGQSAKNAVKPTNKGLTALYSRLSKDDELRGDSNSIKNQKMILENTAAVNGFTNIAYFIDDGVSGTTFERDDWKRLISEIEAGNVSQLLVKDMSRLGRDHVQVGMYMELFRRMKVRFMAIENSIDSIHPETLEFAPFINIMAEWYARDTSRKVKSVLKAKGSSGKRLTNAALYGYTKSSEDKNIWTIDEAAAAVVRRIFQLTIDGNGPYKISRILKAENILRPSAYIAIRDGREIPDPEYKYCWVGRTVQNILDKPDYMGHTVNFKTYKDSYKDKRTLMRPQEEWVIFKDTQPPIIDEATWETAQKCRVVRRRPSSRGETNPLTGLILCADCGSRMYNNVKPMAYRQPSQNSYRCSKFASYLKNCTLHHIQTSILQNLILETIRSASSFVRERESEFVNLMRETSEFKSEEAAKLQKKQLSKYQNRCAELDTLIKRLYEQMHR